MLILKFHIVQKILGRTFRTLFWILLLSFGLIVCKYSSVSFCLILLLRFFCWACFLAWSINSFDDFIKSTKEILKFNLLFKRWCGDLCWSWITLINIVDMISIVIAKDVHLFPSVFFWLCFHIENVGVFKNQIINNKDVCLRHYRCQLFFLY